MNEGGKVAGGLLDERQAGSAAGEAKTGETPPFMLHWGETDWHWQLSRGKAYGADARGLSTGDAHRPL
uniref:Uncharacterized protein n=1 Tax=Thermogemmatispora argillosa TaxID=2045280 RepID=A0A455T5Y3_9CHLR|nr:hypothetical protein KTA_29100 [Thermogemmatispora argillosa]